jgi:hypothetical protein
MSLLAGAVVGLVHPRAGRQRGLCAARVLNWHLTQKTYKYSLHYLYSFFYEK